MIDITGIAVFVIWTSKTSEQNDDKLQRRRLFLHELDRSSVDGHLDRRRHNQQALEPNVRLAMRSFELLISSTVSTLTSETDTNHAVGCAQENAIENFPLVVLSIILFVVQIILKLFVIRAEKYFTNIKKRTIR